MKLAYSAEAVADLVRLRAFIAQQDPSAAARVAQQLISRIENLRLFPAMGRSVGLAPEPNVLRDAVFGKYVVRYSTHTDAVVVLRVWHHYENREQGL